MQQFRKHSDSCIVDSRRSIFEHLEEAINDFGHKSVYGEVGHFEYCMKLQVYASARFNAVLLAQEIMNRRLDELLA